MAADAAVVALKASNLQAQVLDMMALCFHITSSMGRHMQCSEGDSSTTAGSIVQVLLLSADLLHHQRC